MNANKEFHGSSIEDLESLEKIWHKTLSESVFKMKQELVVFNMVYRALSEAEVIILNAEDNSEAASWPGLNRITQERPCSLHKFDERPPIDDYLGKKTVLLTVSASGNPDMARKVEMILEKIRKYPERVALANKNFRSIGITATYNSPLEEKCDICMVFPGNSKHSSSDAEHPSKYMGEESETCVFYAIKGFWTDYAVKNNIPESEMRRRHR